MQRVEIIQDPLRLLDCYIHTRAYPYPCMMASILTLGRKQPISPGDAWHQCLSRPPHSAWFLHTITCFWDMARDQIHAYSSTHWVCTLRHTPYFVMFAYPDDWVFKEIFQSCLSYRGTCISDVHTRAYPLSVFWGYWMLQNKVDVVLRMNVCDVSNSLTLTICMVMGFWHGMDILDWGITFFFHLQSHFWVVLQGHTPFLSILLVVFLFSRLSFIRIF